MGLMGRIAPIWKQCYQQSDVNLQALAFALSVHSKSTSEHFQVRAEQRVQMKGVAGTWCGFLQCVPAVKGPLFLLAQIGAMLQQPMGDPALADAWKAAGRQITKCLARRFGTIHRQPFGRGSNGSNKSVFLTGWCQLWILYSGNSLDKAEQF